MSTSDANGPLADAPDSKEAMKLLESLAPTGYVHVFIWWQNNKWATFKEVVNVAMIWFGEGCKELHVKPPGTVMFTAVIVW